MTFNYLKKIFLTTTILLSALSLPLFSQDGEGVAEDDFSAIFEEAEDTSEPVVTEKDTGNSQDLSLGTFTIPLQITGKMNAELGLGFTKEDSKYDGTGYFDFKNYIYFTSRPDKYLALKGTLKTSLPADDDDLEGQTNYLYVYEFYFDYLMFNRLYVTAGKKKTVWGNIRLFSDTEEYDGDEDALYTNIMYDSRDHISGILKLPIQNHTFQAIAMYRGGTGTDTPGTKDMSFAGSAEFVFFGTSINIFGRRFPLKDSDLALQYPEYHKNSIVGLEIKRTLFNFDIYGQELGKISEDEDKSFKDIFSSKFDDLSKFDRLITTGGIYRLWADSAPYFGFNFEFQNIYIPEPDEDEKYFTNRFASYAGIMKLGPGKDIGLGVQWNHNITTKVGFVKPGVTISRVLPHCDWYFGGKYEYGYDEAEKGYRTKLTVGTYLKISMDY